MSKHFLRSVMFLEIDVLYFTKLRFGRSYLKVDFDAVDFNSVDHRQSLSLFQRHECKEQEAKAPLLVRRSRGS